MTLFAARLPELLAAVQHSLLGVDDHETGTFLLEPSFAGLLPAYTKLDE